MSASVVKQMRAGEYSFDQIETLLQQRRHVLEFIQRVEKAAVQDPRAPLVLTISKPYSQSPSETVIASAGSTTAPAVQQAERGNLPMTPAGTPANTAASSVSVTPEKRDKTWWTFVCNFKVCHACRPFFQDRVPMSFDTVLNGEVPAVTEKEIIKLPFLDPDVVRNLGTRQPPALAEAADQDPQTTHDTIRQGDGYGEESSEDWTPTSTSNSEAESLLLLDGDDLYPCPGSGICPAWSEFEGCAYDRGFDDGKRALHHGFTPEDESEQAPTGHTYSRLRRTRGTILSSGSSSSAGSSISLPDPRTEPLTPTTPAHPLYSLTLGGKASKAATICGVTDADARHPYGFARSRLPGKDSNSSLGSEVEVEGGGALTEEAVESGMPDIVTSD